MGVIPCTTISAIPYYTLNKDSVPAPIHSYAMRLLFKRDGWSGQRLRVQLAHGPMLGRINLSTWRTGAAITLPSGTCTVRKDPDGALVLYRNGLPEAQAVQPSIFKAYYDV